MVAPSLAGRTIAVPESRELDIFAGLLERRGARVIRCPLVAIHDAPDSAPVLAWCRELASGHFDDVILFTGEGLRRLLSVIERHEPVMRPAFIDGLARVRTIVRGPKPSKVLRELGLQPDVSAVPATTAGVIAALSPVALRGRRVGVQLYGTEPNPLLIDFLAAAGAVVSSVAPYVYADGADDQAVWALIGALQSGAIDALAFTSSAQVRRMFAVGGEAAVREALAHTLIAAVGPVVADALRRHGIEPTLTPEQSYFLKPLTAALQNALGPL